MVKAKCKVLKCKKEKANFCMDAKTCAYDKPIISSTQVSALTAAGQNG